MAMGVSSIQAKPFRPCSPSYFSLLQSSPRYSYMIFSSRSSASSKALHRRETCIVRSCFPNITMSNTSIQFRQDIFYRNYSLVEGRPVGSKTSSVVNIREDTKGEFQNFPDGRDGAYSESDSTNSKDTWSGTQNARSRVQPYIQDQVFAQSGKHEVVQGLVEKQGKYEVDTENVGSYVRHYGDSKSVSVKVKSHKIDGSEKINLFPVQCLGKAVKYNQMESNMEVKSSIGSERRIDKAFDTNGRDSGKTSFKFTNHSSESEITRTDPNALLKEVSMIHSDQGVKYKKPSLFQTQDTWSITPASKAVPQPHMHNQTFLQNGKQVNGHRTYGSYKLVLSSAQSLEKTVKSNEIVSQKNMRFRAKTKAVPSTYEALEDNSRDVTGKKSIKKPNGHRTYGSDKLVLSSAQSLEKTFKSNEIVSQKNMGFRAKTKFVPSTYESLKDSSRNVTGKKSIKKPNGSSESEITRADLCARLTSIYSKVLVVDNVPIAKDVVRLLTGRYRHLVHACDTEVAKINVKQETPVDHGEVICFSIYSGPQADFGNGKSYVWVDVLDGGGKELLLLFAAFFEDPSIKKVWHNYSFDNHVIENYGLNLSGFHADTMHMARLWDSSRWTKGGYSLEALTGDPKVMSGAELDQENNLFGKISMKTIFGRKKTRKDGNEGKFIGIGPVEELQRNERIPWICYSALDAISTLKLYESLKKQLSNKPWHIDGNLAPGKSMFDFYEKFWRPFGEVLVKMETEGMLVDRVYLAEIEQWAKAEQKVAVNCFRKWASKYCADAMYMNVGSDAQLRQLLFGGTMNSKDQNQSLPLERKFKYKNVDNVVEEGKKAPLKYRNMTIQSIGVNLKTAIYTPAGWPSVSGGALKVLAGKVAAEFDFLEDDRSDDDIGNNSVEITAGVLEEKLEKPISSYGTAFEAFENPEDGKEACHAIANVCRTCSIDTLIYNFILPLQSSNISGRNGRIHCSLNINTQTGRLSARRPNLQNQPALEKDRYKIRQAFIAAPGNSLIVADYGQLELRILAHLTNCKSMLDAFKVGGDFHSRTALNMYPHLREAIEEKQVLLEWDPQPGEDKPPVPLLKDVFASERKKAKQLNFSIAYGKTPVGLARDWNVSVEEAMETLDLWYNERKEVLTWQEQRKEEAHRDRCVRTLLGRTRWFPSLDLANYALISHIERAAINTPVQGSAADVAMCAMLEISNNARLKELGWRLLLQVHDEVILEGPSESSEVAKDIVVECMSKPFGGANFLKVDLVVDAKCAQNWYAAK